MAPASAPAKGFGDPWGPYLHPFRLCTTRDRRGGPPGRCASAQVAGIRKNGRPSLSAPLGRMIEMAGLNAQEYNSGCAMTGPGAARVKQDGARMARRNQKLQAHLREQH